MKSFADIGRTLTERSNRYRNVTRDEEQAQEMKRLVRRAIDMKPTDGRVLEDIYRVIKAGGQIMDIRGGFDYNNPLYEDPLAIPRVFAELRKLGAPPVKVPTLLAAMLSPALRLKRKSETDPIDHTDEDFKSDVDIIKICIDLIGKKPVPVETLRKYKMEKFSIELSPEVAAATELTIRDTLQLSEINLGESIQRIRPAIANGEPAVKSKEECRQEQHVKAFLHMAMEPIGTERNRDPESVLTRGAMWKVFLERLEEKMAQDHAPKDDHRIERAAALTEQVYIPLVTAYGHEILAQSFRDQVAKLLHSHEYETVYNATLRTSQKALPKKLQRHVNDLHTAQKITVSKLGNEIFQFIPEEYREFCTITGRIKRPDAILEKSRREPGKKISDHIGLRVIVKLPFAPGDSLENMLREEHTACAQIYAAIDRAATRNQVLALIPEEIEYRDKVRQAREERKKKYSGRSRKTYDREPRADIPYTGEHKDLYAAPRENGYRVIKNKYKIRLEGAPEETPPNPKNASEGESATLAFQVVGAVAHWNNEHGTAAHDGVYKYADLSKSVDTTAQYTVSVFNRDNRIVELTRGSTVADFLAMVDPDTAFSAAAFTIERTVNYFSSSLHQPDNKLTTPLVTGDRIGYSTRPDLICNEDHRRTVITACQTQTARDNLIGRHMELRHIMDNSGGRPKLLGAPKGWAADSKPR